MNAQVKPADLIEEYIELRDLKDQFKKNFEAKCKELYGDRMEEIETLMLNALNQMGVESLASNNGTAFKKIATSVTIADAREFRRHVIGGEHWDLIDWRANKTAVNDLVDRGEAIPPGVNRNAIYVVQFRRK